MTNSKIREFSATFNTTTDIEYDLIVVDDVLTAAPWRLSKKERNRTNKEEKIQKWKNKMRKFDKK